MSMTRRQALVVGSLASGASLLALQTPLRASATGRTADVIAEPGISSVQYFDDAFSAAMSIEYPQVLRVSERALGRGRQLIASLDFDSRVFSPSDSVIVAHGTTTTESGLTAVATGPTTTRVTFPLDRASQAEGDRTVFAALPLRPRSLYPTDNLDAVAPLVFEIRDSASGRRLQRLSWNPAIAATPVLPWGAELAAAWDSVPVLQRDKTLLYRYPSVITCRSVGPGPVPAGSQLRLEVDARLISDVTFTSISMGSDALPAQGYSAAVSRVQSVTTALLTISAPLAAATSLTVRTSVTSHASRPRVHGIRFASATLTAPGSTDSPARATGKLTINDFTPSGSPQVAGVALGTT